ncbi:MAG TPA: aldehyde reductase [Steroidobacteraceae bacterium]|nr:aldehyde reductase [Steroidobacteraceae bacterium]
MSRVLVTGGSGFIGCHCILRLLAAGHEVRASVRNLDREADVRAMLDTDGAGPAARLSFAAATLESDTGWREAVEGCEYVLHVASPFPAGRPAHEDELIVPAREGTLRVLRAARRAGARRVVLTSSFAAIGYGHPPQRESFDERDWTVTSAGASAYAKSKTLAERAAWEFIAEEGGPLELSVINPVAVFGPALGPDCSASIQLVKRMLDGGMPGNPQLYFGVVDVRDVADLHVLAMTHSAAKGERFLAVAGEFMTLQDIAKLLKARMGTAGIRVRTGQLPNWLVRAGAWINPLAREIVPELGKKKSASGAKAGRLLGWQPRTSEDAIVAAGQSLARLGLLRHSGGG